MTVDDDDFMNDVDDSPDEHRNSTGSLTNTVTARNGLRSSIKETFKNVTKASSKVISLVQYVVHEYSPKRCLLY